MSKRMSDRKCTKGVVQGRESKFDHTQQRALSYYWCALFRPFGPNLADFVSGFLCLPRLHV